MREYKNTEARRFWLKMQRRSKRTFAHKNGHYVIYPNETIISHKS